MKTIRQIACLALLSVVAFAQQNTLTKTTLSSAVTSTSTTYVNVASATGITARTTALWINGEFMPVTAVSGTRISVVRGANGTRSMLHASGDVVWLGSLRFFNGYAPAGTCTVGSLFVHPWIDVQGEKLYYCFNSRWREASANNVGTAGTSVTAYETGTGTNRVTRLEFSGLALYTTVAMANEASGQLVYTLPAGTITIHSASYSIALTGSGTDCDADTPDLGLGTVVGSGAQAVLSGVGATSEDILTGQTVNNLTGTAEVKTLANQPLAIESAGVHTVYLNIADGWAAGSCAITATGYILLDWSLLP